MNEEQIKCEYCLEIFKSESTINHHKKMSQYCIKYRNVIFTCKNCDYKTVGIKNINLHECNYSNSKNDNIEFEINKNIEINNNLSQMNNKLISFESKLEKILLLLENNNFNKDITPNKNCIQKSSSSPSPNSIILSPKDKTPSPKSKKHNFKTLKNIIELRKDNIEDISKKIEEIDQIHEDIKDNLYVFNYNKIFQDSFEKLKNFRNYNKTLEIIKSTRIKIIDLMSYNDYSKLLKNHVKQLENIFKFKEYQEKKINSLIQSSLNSLDSRILNFGQYYNIDFDIDEIQKLKTSLTLYNKQYKEFKPFNSDEFFNKFHNYGLVIFTLKENRRNRSNTRRYQR